MLRERGGRSSGSLNGSATQELASSNEINETGARMVGCTCVVSHLQEQVMLRH